MNENFRQDVDTGLSATPKQLLSKYFYDETGDSLFVKIMNMPEYYLTNSEYEIFTTQAEDIIKAFGVNGGTLELIELGAGDGTKTIELLKVLQGKTNFTYVPIDISQNALDLLCLRLAKEVPGINVQPLQGDYFSVLADIKQHQAQKVILFLGSNIGNMLDHNARRFVRQLCEQLNHGDKVLLGVDLKKDASIILPAYNDAQGITRDFNLNLLTRINRELGGNFVVSLFEHKPLYNEELGQAESYIQSMKDQDVHIKATGKTYHFDKGERIHMEISRKYDDKTINDIISDTGLQLKHKFTDSKNYFADYILVME
ncbi:MAG: L-histidine N(alpha)-methyltransferase [Chitinophagaceae bacterium]|nr:L-histidine N(alpha)-methyltransferase [Chitinophagaceae bacterium]MCB9045858.1 L-histidine N(alpha)-methyltransferase [Chitinophagales bacterium]